MGVGKPKDPAYWRKWRAAHPEYKARERVRCRNRQRGDRSAEYARNIAQRKSRAKAHVPLPALFPHIIHGARLSFWEDELRMDLEQERALAILEGRDPAEAVKAYRRREINWYQHTGSLNEALGYPSAR